MRSISPAALALACALVACHDTPTEPAPPPSPTPTPTVTPTATPTAVPPVHVTWFTPCSPLSEPRFLTAAVCGCVTEPMTVTVNGGPPAALACDGTLALSFDNVVTVSTAHWSLSARLAVPSGDPHCGITARLVCGP